MKTEQIYRGRDNAANQKRPLTHRQMKLEPILRVRGGRKSRRRVAHGTWVPV